MLYRVCALFTLALVVLSGCGQAEPYEELTWIENAQASAAAVPYFGVESIEEIILRSDTIARVELLSKSTSVEQAASTAWVPKLEFRFRVVEYLKGSGPKEITAFVHSIWATEAEARAALPLQSTGHDSRWDDREAVVFLSSDWDAEDLPSLPAAGKYRMGWMWSGNRNEDGYTVASRWSKLWLPAAQSSGSTDGTRSTETNDPLFLLDVPGASSTGGRSASTQTQTGPTIHLSALKTKIGALESELNAGGTEAYRACVRSFYERERVYRARIENPDTVDGRARRRFDHEIASGLPAGTLIHEDVAFGFAPDNTGRTWYEGRNSDIVRFEASDFGTSTFINVVETPIGNLVDYKRRTVTTRPLPAGSYQFYLNNMDAGQLVCNMQPQYERNLLDHRLTVTRTDSPPRTLHEAFFDPVAIGNAVGADSSNGVLEPNAFALDGTTTTISSLKWQDGAVTMTLSPTASLADYAIDFIDVNGTTTLSLTSDNASTTALTWTVPDKPWADGDLLMLRIHKPISTDATLSGLALSGIDLAFDTATTTYAASVPATTTQTTVTPTTNHASATYVVKLAGVTDLDGTIPLAAGDNLITVDVTAEDGVTTETYTVTITRATPAAPVTVTLTPRVEGLTFFDLTIQWADPQTCDNRYFVTVRRNDGYIVRNMGLHPAETTSATLVTYWPMDNVPDFVAVVECDPSSGPRREVGRMSLRSARN